MKSIPMVSKTLISAAFHKGSESIKTPSISKITVSIFLNLSFSEFIKVVVGEYLCCIFISNINAATINRNTFFLGPWIMYIFVLLNPFFAIPRVHIDLCVSQQIQSIFVQDSVGNALLSPSRGQ